MVNSFNTREKQDQTLSFEFLKYIWGILIEMFFVNLNLIYLIGWESLWPVFLFFIYSLNWRSFGYMQFLFEHFQVSLLIYKLFVMICRRCLHQIYFFMKFPCIGCSILVSLIILVIKHTAVWFVCQPLLVYFYICLRHTLNFALCLVLFIPTAFGPL